MESQSTPDFSEKITLDPLNQPPIGNHGMLIIKMPPSATNPTRTNGSSYTVEFRRKAGWDRNIPKDAVLIHEVRGNSFSYLQPQIWGQFVSGEEFFTPDPKVFTKIIGIDSNAGTAAVHVWDIPQGRLRKEASKPKVYLIEGGKKCWVPSEQVLTQMGKTWDDVREVPDGGLTSLMDGPDVQLSGSYRMWHTIRSPGGWQAWGNVSATVQGNPGLIKNLTSASVVDKLHVVALSWSGNMWHTIRSPGGWQAWGDVSATVTGNPGINFKTVACASIGNDLHVISVADNGNMWHTIRSPGGWQAWGDVSATVTGNPGINFKTVACASIGNDLHVISVADNGNMWHTIRSPGGWQAWGDVSATVTGNPGINFKTVACASIGNDLHVISVADNGNMWHTIRSPGGWQAWGDVSATVTGNPGINFKTVACASIGNDLHGD